MKTFKIKDGRITRIFQACRTTASGINGRCIGYVKNGKRFMYAVSVILACIMPVAITATFTGCAQTTQKKAETALFTTHTSVDAAYQSYLRLVIAGQTSTNAFPRVATAYTEFQAVYNAAVLLVAGNSNAAAPQSVTSAALNFTTVIAEAKGTK